MDCREKQEEEGQVGDRCYSEIVGEKRGNEEVRGWNCLWGLLFETKEIQC
jgi:hypothetical protein